MGPQIPQKSRSHLQSLGPRRVTRAFSILRTHSSGVACDPDCRVALFAGTYERIQIFACKGGKIQ